MATGLGKAEAFKNLKLDADFFNKSLSKIGDSAPEEFQDFDVYLMEKSVMPLLLQGLDALSRHVDQRSQQKQSLEGRPPFNPLVWLAQYLLRNHPRYVKDHRNPMYEKFTELANIERGRRCLLRRKDQLEEVWNILVERNGGSPLTLDDLPKLFEELDAKWYLDGALVEKMPEDFSNVGIEKSNTAEGDEVFFAPFFRWFEDYVGKNDVLRAGAFIDAENRQVEVEKKAKKDLEDAVRRERAMKEAMEQRAELEEQFETVTADMFINEDLGMILNRGAVIEGVEEKEGGPPLQGEHVMLIQLMLGIWGCPVDDGTAGDVWNDRALAAWKQWLQGRSVKTSNPVDKVTLRRLMDKDEFQDYLQTAYPVKDGTDEDFSKQVVEVKGLVEDEIETLVEAFDEETGELLHFTIPENEVAALRERLAGASSTNPLLASADRISGRILELMPADSK